MFGAGLLVAVPSLHMLVRKPNNAPAGNGTDRCIVQRIIDGDTLRCENGVTVRLLLIDAPERDQGDAYRQATNHLKKLAPPGTVLRMEYDVGRKDRYGRTLAHLFAPDGRSLNEEMLRAGMAVVVVFPPNVRYVDRYRKIADSARAARRGLWAGDAFACTRAERRAGRCK